MVNWFCENGFGWMKRIMSGESLKTILTVLVVTRHVFWRKRQRASSHPLEEEEVSV